MEERLKYILAQVIDWLKFAETKNAALVGFTGAAILALIGAVKDIGNAAISYFIIHVTIPGFLIALFISLNSFRGILSKYFKHRAAAPSKDDHVFFYGDIQKYTDKQYLHKLYTLHEETAPEKFNRLEIELACQIIINSKVASRKFRLFNTGLNVTLATVALSFILAILPYYSSSVLHFFTDCLDLGIEKYSKP